MSAEHGAGGTSDNNSSLEDEKRLFLVVWEADAVYLTMRDLSMLLCVLWDLSAILCACAYSCRTCVPVHIPQGLFLRDLYPIYETREHRTLTNLAQSVIGTFHADA
ncbi:hypothetical protein Bbelb_150490 [Branchiostoma belcheri]|nr:hypothetical protein Bbelb_150490 [Branchiostoma belcheri]